MAFPVTQPFKRTTKSLRFEDDVLTKSQMLQATDDEYETGYAVIDKDTLEQYVYNANATPSQTTGKFVKSSSSGGGASLTIDTTDPNYGDATISEGGQNLSFTNQNGQGVRIGGISEDGEMVTSKTYVDTKLDEKKALKAIRGVTTTTEIINAVNDGKSILVYWTQADESPRLVTKVEIDSPYVVYLSCTFTTTDGDTYAGLFKVHTDVETTWTYESKKLASFPSGGTTGQVLAKKSNADGDVEWADQTVIVGSDWGVAKAGVIPSVGTSATVSIDISELGLSSVDDYTVNLDIVNGGEIYPAATLRIASRTATSFGIRNTSSTNVYGAVYTVFAKGYGSVPNGGTTGQALVKKSNTDGDVEWKTVSGGGASLTIDTTQVGYGEATISEGGQNLSFTNQNGQGVHIGGISENGEMVASKTYVDSKSPTIVNEGATFTNAQGNQKMQIRTGGTNSVIIKDINGTGTTEYWSYELPDKSYVDTEVAKRNAVVNFDNEYKTLQIRDVNDSVEFQVVKETSNDYIRVNEYAEDDRGQMQQIFDVKLPTKEYVDSKGGGVNMEVGAEKWYGTYTENNVTYQTYTKIVYIPALPSTAGITTYPMGVSNIKQILDIYGYTTDGFILNAPRQNAQDNISIYQVSKGSQTFSIEVGKDRSSKSAYVTIVYAKNNT